jgi:hypothetical protein
MATSMGDKWMVVKDVNDLGFNLKTWLWWLSFIMELICTRDYNTLWAPLNRVWFKMWGYHSIYSCCSIWQIGEWGRNIPWVDKWIRRRSSLYHHLLLGMCTYYCNLNLGLATKAKACKVVDQKGNPGVTSHAFGSAK